ncbi:hypothetical protein HDU67_002804 [Dinochytrium kinnereticum]|nr:hypothetical protein HDU67_002804 [Dinochytrium kinnereticum]
MEEETDYHYTSTFLDDVEEDFPHTILAPPVPTSGFRASSKTNVFASNVTLDESGPRSGSTGAAGPPASSASNVAGSGDKKIVGSSLRAVFARESKVAGPSTEDDEIMPSDMEKIGDEHPRSSQVENLGGVRKELNEDDLKTSRRQKRMDSRGSGKIKKPSLFLRPRLNAVVQDGECIPSRRFLQDQYLYPNPSGTILPTSTLLPDILFAICTVRLTHLLSSLPLYALPRFLVMALSLLTTHSLLFVDHDSLVAQDDFFNVIYVGFRCAVVIGMSWTGLLALNTVEPSLVSFLLFLMSGRVIHGLALFFVALFDRKASTTLLLRILILVPVPCSLWVSGVLVPPQIRGWRDILWTLAGVSEGLGLCIVSFMEDRMAVKSARSAAARSFAGTSASSSSLGNAVPVVYDWNRDVRARLVRLTGIFSVTLGLLALYPFRQGLGEVDAALVSYRLGPFFATVMAFIILYAVERIAAATNPHLPIPNPVPTYFVNPKFPLKDKPELFFEKVEKAAATSPVTVQVAPPKKAGIGTLAVAAAAAAALRFGPSASSTISSYYATRRGFPDIRKGSDSGRCRTCQRRKSHHSFEERSRLVSELNPPLATLWRIVQFPIHLSILVAGAGLRMVIQSLFDGWSGNAGFVPIVPPGLEDLDPRTPWIDSLASPTPISSPSPNFIGPLPSATSAAFAAPSPLSNIGVAPMRGTTPISYAGLLFNYTTTVTGASSSLYPNAPEGWWDPKRGETLLSLGLACFVFFTAISSLTLSTSASITGYLTGPCELCDQYFDDGEEDGEDDKVHVGVSDRTLEEGTASWLSGKRTSSSASGLAPRTQSRTRISRRIEKVNSVVTSSDLSEREEAFWRDVWVTSPESSFRSKQFDVNPAAVTPGGGGMCSGTWREVGSGDTIDSTMGWEARKIYDDGVGTGPIKKFGWKQGVGQSGKHSRATRSTSRKRNGKSKGSDLEDGAKDASRGRRGIFAGDGAGWSGGARFVGGFLADDLSHRHHHHEASIKPRILRSAPTDDNECPTSPDPSGSNTSPVFNQNATTSSRHPLVAGCPNDSADHVKSHHHSIDVYPINDPDPTAAMMLAAIVMSRSRFRSFLFRMFEAAVLVAAVPLATLIAGLSGSSWGLIGGTEAEQKWPVYNTTMPTASNVTFWPGDDGGRAMRQHQGDATGLWSLVLCAGVMLVAMLVEEGTRIRRRVGS